MSTGAPARADTGIPVVERDAELARIVARLDDAFAGTGATVAVEGPAGIGKSTLLAAAARAAAERRMPVLRARAGQTEQGFAFGVVRQLLEPVLRRSGPEARAELFDGVASTARVLFDAGPSASAEHDVDDLLHALYWVVAGLAERRPLLIVVDDAQWADAPSLRFMLHLARRVADLPVVSLVAMRPRDLGAGEPLPAMLSADADTDRIDLRALSEAGVEQVVAAALGSGADPGFISACAAATGGNPFLLGELLGELARSGARPVRADVARVRGVQPSSVVRTVLLRLARLPPGAVAIARAVAVLENAPFAVVTALAGVPGDEADAHVDALVADDVLMAEDGLEFVHPMLRDVVYADVLPRERARLHAAAVAVLRRAGAPAERQAVHLELADAPLGREDVAVLRQAATEASARGSPEAAAAALRRVTRSRPTPDADVLADLGRAEYSLGNALTAVDMLERAVAAAPGGAPPATLRSHLASARMAAGDAAGALRELERTIEGLGDEDRELMLRLEAKLAGYAVPLGVDTSRLNRFAGLAGDTPGERQVLATLGVLRGAAGDGYAEGVEWIRRALSGGALLDELELDSSLVNLVGVLAFAEHLDEADAAARRLRQRARERGSVVGALLVTGNAGVVALVRGDLRTAVAEFEDAVRLGEEVAWSGTPIWGLYLLHAQVERGSLAEADRVLDTVTWRPPFARPGAAGSIARAVLRLEQGRPAEALEDLRAAAAMKQGVALSRWRDWRIHSIRALLALGETMEARQLAEVEFDLARRRGYDRPIGQALHHLALACSGEEALELFRRAVTHLDATPARFELASALVDQGAALRRANRPADAREPLRRGADLAEWCGAEALAERAGQELAATGMRRRRSRSDADELTPSERRVASMAAEGLTNKEIAQTLFVTLKTVETHLGNAYRKLGVSSRRQLGDVL